MNSTSNVIFITTAHSRFKHHSFQSTIYIQVLLSGAVDFFVHVSSHGKQLFARQRFCLSDHIVTYRHLVLSWQKTFDVCAPMKRALVLKVAVFIEWYHSSCAREEISPTTTALVASPSMDASLMTRTLCSNILALVRPIYCLSIQRPFHIKAEFRWLTIACVLLNLCTPKGKNAGSFDC